MDDFRSGSVSSSPAGAPGKHPKDLRYRDPDIHQTHAAHSPPQVSVVPKFVPGGLKMFRCQPGKVILAPCICPGINKQEEAQFKTENNEQDRRKALYPSCGGGLVVLHPG